MLPATLRVNARANPRVNTRLGTVSASVCSALLLGLGGAQALAQGELPAVPLESPTEVAQSAINALAAIAANAGNNEALVQAAIAAITNIALQSINTPPLYHQPLSPALAGPARQAPPAAPAWVQPPSPPLVIEMAVPTMEAAEAVVKAAASEPAIVADPAAASPAEEVVAEGVATEGAATDTTPADASPAEVAEVAEVAAGVPAAPAGPAVPEAGAAPAHTPVARTENDAMEEALAVQVSTLVQDTPLVPKFVPEIMPEPAAHAREPVVEAVTEAVPAPVNLTALAASLSAGVLKDAHAQPALLPALALPPLTVDVEPAAPIASMQAEAPAPAVAQADMPVSAPAADPLPLRLEPVATARAEAPVAVPAPAAPVAAPATPATKITPAAPASPAPNADGKLTFNTRLLVFPVDMDLYADGENPVLPGTYRLDVYLNDSWAGKFDVRFANLNPDDRIAQPCFDAGMLEALGFDPQYYAPGMKARLEAGESICGQLSQIVDGAGSSFNDGEHKLMLTAPQVVLVRVPRGYVDPKRWDAGITAATLGYAYNAYSSKQGGSFPGGTQTSHYLGLRSSLNLGDWRVRFRSTFNKSARRDLTHRRDSLYVERGVPSLKSRLVIGESATSGHVFDSISILGAQLVSDTRMRPDSQNAFVPIIRGIAQSNAKVTVHQRGEQVYEMTVPPGPFIIDDLYPNGTGGDLLVTITEADGTQRTFIETYANLPEMLRPGTMHYSATVGRYRNRMFEEEPVMGMLTGSYGFNNTVTGYGGVMLAAGYHSASIGAGFNLPVGAVSADATWANTRADTPTGGLSSNGYAFRVGWTKFMPKVDTDVTLAMYRYATKGFYEPAQAFQFRETLARGGSQATFRPWGNVRRNQLALRLSHQPKGKWGAMSFGASVQDYWDRQGRDVSYHLGWGRSIGSASLGLTVNRSRNVGANRWENQYMLTLSLPLGRSTGNPVYTNTSLTKRRNSVSGQTSVSGTLGERHQVGWSLFASGNKSKNSDLHKNGGGSLSATTSINRMGASYSASSGGSRQTSVSTSGAMVAFNGGVILSPELGETIGLVQAKNAVGARVQGARASSLNAKGHAVVPYLRPYRENNVHLDPKGLSTDVELGSTSQKVAPTDGAVVLLNYETRQGWAMLVSGKRADGSALPFAAGVLNEDGRNVGYVAQGGQALIRADAPQGALTVRWGPLQDQRCHFDYDLTGDKFNLDGTGFRRVEVICK